MRRQKSFDETGGLLYIVGTPIGNLEDVSARVHQTLEQADLIACEDTRHTRKLLSHLGLAKPMISYHEHNRFSRMEELTDRMEAGERVALVSDAGMPGLSDPGEELVREAVERGVPVIPVPGPNAALTAVVASGLPAQPFLFVGFLPRHSKERKAELERWRHIPASLLFYEAPHRIRQMLADVQEVLGDREAAIARELTKKHEEWLRGRVSECLTWFEEEQPRGEMTVVIKGASPETKESQGEEESSEWWRALTIMEHVDWHIHRGSTKKEAIQATARERDLPKREVYNTYHKDQK
ncbi:16S rRNA (cytidine(1402)-2'-O)-methyltransferase [Salinithrix halophila]|uniref:Ribosomal RNA small subunit methyltransferase I n=1 Tax=Salinithrix halophila TaxID=1485204 RepID=A0ABV8JE14_9BACL